MTLVTNRYIVLPHETTGATLASQRDDWLVKELLSTSNRVSGQLVFVGDGGPFSTWRRTLDFPDTGMGPSRRIADGQSELKMPETQFLDDSQDVASGEGSPLPPHRLGSGVVVETIEFKIRAGLWSLPISVIVKRSLCAEAKHVGLHGKRPRDGSAPWWAPPDRFDAKSTSTVALLTLVAFAAAYLGTLLSQTMTFVADEFGADRSVQGAAAAVTRVGAIIGLGLVTAADRVGRKSLLLVAGAGSALFALVAVASNSIWLFAGSQTVSRGFASGLALLVGVIAAEESPPGSRAWVTSALALCAGLGSGAVLWLLPIAELGVSAWRVLFVVPLAVFPLLVMIRRQLQESQRYLDHVEHGPSKAKITNPMVRRFCMIGTVTFAVALFAAPASNFLNEFLREERGFSAARISLYSALVSTPVGIGVAIAGPLADRKGRRVIGMVGLVGGASLAALRFTSHGWPMWALGGASTIIGAAAIPALGVYGPELFPTSRRATANGLLMCVGVLGSVIGLLVVGFGAQSHSFGAVFMMLMAAPIAAALIVWHYPETAGQTLEEINPAVGSTSI